MYARLRGLARPCSAGVVAAATLVASQAVADVSFQGLGDLPGGTDFSEAFAVSADGSTVVGRSNSGFTEAFIWTAGGGMTGLGDLPGGSDFSEANAVSADGSTVVGQSNSGFNEAFIWDADNGMRSLADVLTAAGVDLTGWTLTEATGISDDGLTIVGWGTNPDGFAEGWIATIPSPGALALLGISALAGTRSRRRQG